jgi:predicted phage tail protein
MNGKPLADVRLSFTRRAAPREAASVTNAQTDDAGYYFAGFETPGEYAVRVMHTRAMFSGSRQTTLVEGANTFDLAVTGGIITVVFTGASGRSRLSLTIENQSGVIGGADMAGAQTHEFGGLAFGEYRVAVRRGAQGQRTPPASTQDVKTVTLTSASPNVTVTFDLNK